MNSRLRFASIGLLAVLCLVRCWAEEDADKPEGDKQAKPGKWAAAMAAFEKQDKENTPPKDAVLLVGSSSFTKWKSAGKDLAPLPVINRGFGGSTMSAVLENYDKLVPPYHPKTVVLYEGSNDLAGGTKKVEQVFAEIKTFVEKVNKDLPDAQIVILSVHLAPVRAKSYDSYRELNKMVAEYAKSAKNVTALDATTGLLKDGQPQPDIYGPDHLHLNAEGYKLWCAIIKPVLEKIHGAPAPAPAAPAEKP